MSANSFKISPKYDSTKLSEDTIENRIDVYEDRVRGWLLECAKILNHHTHAGFGVLQVVSAYFEGHAVFYKGEDSRGKSDVFFKNAVVAVFPSISELPEPIIEEILKVLYTDLRCGLFHVGMTRGRILLQDGSPALRVTLDDSGGKVEAILIDRYKIVEAVDKHLTEYVKRLRDSKEEGLRRRFMAAWDICHSG